MFNWFKKRDELMDEVEAAMALTVTFGDNELIRDGYPDLNMNPYIDGDRKMNGRVRRIINNMVKLAEKKQLEKT